MGSRFDALRAFGILYALFVLFWVVAIGFHDALFDWLGRVIAVGLALLAIRLLWRVVASLRTKRTSLHDASARTLARLAPMSSGRRVHFGIGDRAATVRLVVGRWPTRTWFELSLGTPPVGAELARTFAAALAPLGVTRIEPGEERVVVWTRSLARSLGAEAEGERLQRILTRLVLLTPYMEEQLHVRARDADGPARCPYCHDDLASSAERAECRRCGSAHHVECLSEHGACAVFGCSSRPGLARSLARG